MVIADNFPSHKSKFVRQKAKKLDIYLVYLPPYSPDLNPIEFIWKSIERVLSISIASNLDEMKQIITESLVQILEMLELCRLLDGEISIANRYYKNLCG